MGWHGQIPSFEEGIRTSPNGKAQNQTSARLLRPQSAARRRRFHRCGSYRTRVLTHANVEYGARYLKRAIERLVVQPLSRLIASGHISDGDFIEIDHEFSSSTLTFTLHEGVAP